MRYVSAAAAASATQQLGSDPKVIIAIYWKHHDNEYSGVKYYGDHEFTLGNMYVENRVINLGSIGSSQISNNVSTIEDVSFTLSDVDYEIKGYIDNNYVEGIPVVIYQHWDGNDSGDLVTIFDGILSTPYAWDEGSHTCEISAVSKFDSQVVGNILRKTDIDADPAYQLLYAWEKEVDAGYTDYYAKDSAFGVYWPVCFGQPLMVPCFQLLSAPESKTESKLKPDSTSIFIKSGSRIFPEGIIELVVEGVHIFGEFATPGSDEFTIATANNRQYVNLPRYASPGIEIPLEDQSDADFLKNKITISTVTDGQACLTGMWILVKDSSTNSYSMNKVAIQDGVELTCTGKFQSGVNRTQKVLAKQQGVVFEDAIQITSSWSIVEVAGKMREDWLHKDGIIRPVTYSDKTGLKLKPWKDWSIASGKKCYLAKNYSAVGADPKESDSPATHTGAVYVVNSKALTEVKNVYAVRKVGRYDRLVKVPESYYTVQLDTTIAGKSCATVTFNNPLWLRIGEKWKPEKIWVDVNAGSTNTATQIEAIIDDYTNFEADSTTFSAVETLIENYPSNFAITKGPDALEVIQDIAFQARCGLNIQSDGVTITYLSKEPSSTDFTLNEEATERDSLRIIASESTDIVTRLVGEWNLTLFADEASKHIFPTEVEYSESGKIQNVVTNNTDLYGEREQTIDFWIYNNEECVQKSLDFYINRMSQSWVIIEASVFLKGIGLQTFDTVNLNYDISNLVPDVDGVVRNVSHDLLRDSISLSIWTPVLIGTTSAASDAWLDDSGDVKPTQIYSRIYPRQRPVDDKENVDYWPLFGITRASVHPSADWTGILSDGADNKVMTVDQVDFLHKAQAATVMQAKIYEEYNNYLVCIPIQSGRELPIYLYVAKPYTLRTYPFHKTWRTNKGYDEDYDGFIYDYAAAPGRQVTDDTTGTVTIEEVYPSYYVDTDDRDNHDSTNKLDPTPEGDIITIIYMPAGTGVWTNDQVMLTIDEAKAASESNHAEITWLDMNTSGRHWRHPIDTVSHFKITEVDGSDITGHQLSRLYRGDPIFGSTDTTLIHIGDGCVEAEEIYLCELVEDTDDGAYYWTFSSTFAKLREDPL
jgi:hypothetical protein